MLIKKNKMKSPRNVILIDSDKEEVKDFKSALEETTQREWEVYVCNSNRKRNKLYNMLRYAKYFLFPLKIFIKRESLNLGTIVAWQQFYGIIYAFYCRLFHVKKRSIIIVMSFIYKRKKGALGSLYHKFIRYSLQGGYISLLTCTAKAEISLYADTFGIEKEKFVYVPWGIIDYSGTLSLKEEAEEPFIYSPGRSNRDWQFLINTLKDSSFKLKICCDELKSKKVGNVEIRNDIYGIESFQYLKNCYCVAISIKDTNISAGQTVLLNAMNFGKPVVITASKGITDDYVIDGYNGLVINKEEKELLEALNRLYTDKELYQRLSRNSLQEYKSKYSTYSQGKNVGQAMLQFM